MSASGDELLTLAAAIRLVGVLTGEEPCNSAIWYWTRRGVRGPDGERVRLRADRFGHLVVTTRAAVVDFLRTSGKLKAVEKQVEELVA
ncbi:unnamed protein product [Gemmataceae bacterium]|nr:unnamed protein product [Gemmataceae bacterium]VTT97590.1 unnamed protein product [Gemmataceae bacterium]